MLVNTIMDNKYLKSNVTLVNINYLLREAKQKGFTSICVNPSYVGYCHDQLYDTNILVSTVIGYPFGLNTIETKVSETIKAFQNGADEVNFLVNIGELKSGNYEYIEEEFKQIIKAANNNPVKCIIDKSHLTEKEYEKVSEIASKLLK